MLESTQKTNRKLPNWLYVLEGWVLGLLVGVAALLFVGTNLVFFTHADRVLPNIYIEDQLVGGLNQAELTELVEKSFVIEGQMNLKIDNPPINLSTTAKDLELKFDPQAAIETALLYGKTGPWIERTKILIGLVRRPLLVELKPQYNQTALEEMVVRAAQLIDQEHRPPSASLGQSSLIETLEIDPGQIGLTLDTEGGKHNLSNQIKQNARNTSVRARLSPTLNLDLTENINSTGRSLSETEVQNAKQRAEKLVGKKLKLTSQVASFTLDDKELVSLLAFPTGVSQAQLEKHLGAWSQKIDSEPIEPVFEYDPNTLKVKQFTPPRDGLKLEESELMSKIALLLEDMGREEFPEIELPTTSTPPKISLAETNTLGISEKIGHGSSLFRGSPSNRVHNISVSANRTSLILIAPGQEFSFNRTLGEVSVNTGYRQAYVIRAGRTELGDGGGVCQVSTTVFRAALDAGLKITRRLQHSYRVGYYEQNSLPGLDATVYSGGIDLRFVNDTDEHILIYNEVNSSNLSMKTEIYGTSDGRQTEIIEHRVWDHLPAPPPEYYPDPSLPEGTLRQIDWAVGGVKTRVVNQIRSADGEVIREDEYFSNYRPWAAKYLQGV